MMFLPNRPRYWWERVDTRDKLPVLVNDKAEDHFSKEQDTVLRCRPHAKHQWAPLPELRRSCLLRLDWVVEFRLHKLLFLGGLDNCCMKKLLQTGLQHLQE